MPDKKSKSADAAPQKTGLATVDFGDEEFFDELDKQVQGKEEEKKEEQPPVESPEPATEAISADELAKLRDDLKHSSTESRRLNEIVKNAEPYMPILDAMRNNPELIQHVKNYYEGGGEAPGNFREQLKLGEDFVFDADEAFSNPDSDSGRLFNGTVDRMVQKRLAESQQVQSAESRRIAEEMAFRQKNEMDDKSFDDLVSYAKTHKLTLDDIQYLKNREKNENNILKSHTQEKISQLSKMQETPKSLASIGKGSEEVPKDEDKLFSSIKKAMDEDFDNVLKF